jgi:uncharacterized protein YdcH (DUF465 family)
MTDLSWLFESISKIDKLLSKERGERERGREREREEMKEETLQLKLMTQTLKKVIKMYYKQLHANKLGNLQKNLRNIQTVYKLWTLNHEEIESVITVDIESIINNLPTKKISTPIVLWPKPQWCITSHLSEHLLPTPSPQKNKTKDVFIRMCRVGNLYIMSVK